MHYDLCASCYHGDWASGGWGNGTLGGGATTPYCWCAGVQGVSVYSLFPPPTPGFPVCPKLLPACRVTLDLYTQSYWAMYQPTSHQRVSSSMVLGPTRLTNAIPRSSIPGRDYLGEILLWEQFPACRTDCTSVPPQVWYESPPTLPPCSPGAKAPIVTPACCSPPPHFVLYFTCTHTYLGIVVIRYTGQPRWNRMTPQTWGLTPLPPGRPMLVLALPKGIRYTREPLNIKFHAFPSIALAPGPPSLVSFCPTNPLLGIGAELSLLMLFMLSVLVLVLVTVTVLV